MKKAIKNLILFLVFAVPLIFVPGMRDMFALPKVSLLRFGAVLLTGALLADTGIYKKLKFNRLFLAAVVYFGTRIVAAVFSENPSLSWNGMYFYYFDGSFQIMCFAVFFIAVQTALSDNAFFEEKIYKAIAAAVLATGIYGLFQFAGFDFVRWKGGFGRIFSTLGNPDFFAGWLLLCIPALVGGCINASSKKSKIFFGASAVVAFVNLILAFSRAGWLGAAASLIALIFFMGAKQKRQIPYRAQVKGFVFAALFALALIAAFGPRSWNEGLKPRLMGWKAGYRAFRERPVMGRGPAMFSTAAERYLPAEFSRLTKKNGNPAYAHNIFIDQLVSAGILGLAAFFWLLFEFYRRSGNYPFLASAVTGGLVYGFFSIGTLSFWLYFWIYAGIAAFLQEENKRSL